MSTGKVIAPAIAPSVVNTAAITSGLTTAATVAGVALLAVGGAAAAVVITRAVMGGMASEAARIESAAEEWKSRQAAAEAWQEAVLDVIDRNSRIAEIRSAYRRLRRTTGTAGDDPDLPAPLNPGGRPLAELRDWCDAVDARLPAAETRLAASTIAGGLAWLATLPGQARVKTAAEALAERHLALRSQEVPPPAPKDGMDFPAAVDRILARLPADVTDEAYAGVVEAGAQVLAAPTATAAESWLTELRVREQQATEEAAIRRAGVRTADRYLTALRLEEISADLFPPEDTARFDTVRTRLEAVVNGTAELTAELRREAEDSVMQAQDLADSCLIRESLRAAFAELGYTVQEPATASAAEALTFNRDDLDDHTVTVRMVNGELNADFRRAGSEDVSLIDPACLRRWRQDFRELAAEVVRLGVNWELISTEDLAPEREKEREEQDREDEDERSASTDRVRYKERRR
jgi:hypothetical protein